MTRDIRKEGLDSIGEDELLTTGQVVKLTGVTERMLGNYCEKGLLHPQRTGESISNNRRYYSKDDLRQLGRVKALQEYGFRLDEIKGIFDGTADAVVLLQERLEELKREEARLHSLIMFAKFIDMTDDDIVDGLLYGSLGMDELADAVRETPECTAMQERIESLSDEELMHLRESVEPILNRLMNATSSSGFSELERAADAFALWWQQEVLDVSESSFLQLWTSFEDGSLVATQVEEVGGEAAPAAVQSALYYAFMNRLMRDASGLTVSIAQHAETDVVQAMSEAEELISIIDERMGAPDTAASVLQYMERMLEDAELMAYLDPERVIIMTPVTLKRTQKVIDLLHGNVINKT